ncbi:HdeD family acid-resistance protein [uncultured Thiodictyon sp.]|uniref:HdeD family acid-resistance protein n=1 Tax=uncultured Thiodictyon sp. TaxID=1846217 RepID=UPI0025E46DFF|nr:HdeD family acid-resistance protein [uncultured Thiodictyon sp.]
MSANHETRLATTQGTFSPDLQKNWGWLLVLGLSSIALGTLGFYMTFALTLVSVLFFGVLILAAGIFQLIHAFTCTGWKSVFWHVLIALLYVVAGVDIMIDPVRASAILTLVLAGLLIAVGLLRSIMAFQLRSTAGWLWPLLSGLVSIALGAMILAQWPISGLWVIGLFVAIELVFNGWSYLIIALAVRRAGREGRISA